MDAAQLPSLLPSLAWFALVAQHGSFTKASAEVGITRAALSQNLKALEQRLNVRLLHRTTRNLSLTEEGRHLLEVLQPALSNIQRAVHELDDAGLEPSGLLRVNTSRIAAKMLLEPHMGEFLARFPKLQLELVMDDGLSNIVAEGCDAGLRFGESLAEHMVGPLIYSVSADPVAAAKVLNDFAKTNDKLVLKAGSYAGKVLDKAGVQALASVPSREELLSKLLYVMQAPVAGFVRGLAALAAQREEAAA